MFVLEKVEVAIVVLPAAMDTRIVLRQDTT